MPEPWDWGYAAGDITCGGDGTAETMESGAATGLVYERPLWGPPPPVEPTCQVGASGKTACMSADQNTPMLA